MTERPNNNNFLFSQIHIEVARNSTDDFNLFHDKNHWPQIVGNPFAGPIVLGFQLECLIEYQLRLFREKAQESAIIDREQLQFSNYQFTFANVVKPEQAVAVDIRKSVLSTADTPTLSNRVAIKTDAGVVLLGYKKETQTPLCLADSDLSWLPDLKLLDDRSFFSDQHYFIKRKYMNVGNAKNFLSGSLAEQSDYFDELNDKFIFPETFPMALVSCALLERAFKQGHDFKKDPMVYTSHKFSVDRALNARLKSNDQLNILVAPPQIMTSGQGLGASGATQQLYHCYGLLTDNRVLFRAEISLAALTEILKRA